MQALSSAQALARAPGAAAVAPRRASAASAPAPACAASATLRAAPRAHRARAPQPARASATPANYPGAVTVVRPANLTWLRCATHSFAFRSLRRAPALR
jgi:hypothetical protein